MKKTFVMAALLCMVCVAAVLSSSAEDAAKAVAVQVTGTNVGLVKTVCGEAEQELDATYGNLNVLVVQEALDADGKAIEGMAGKMLHYLPTASASKLLSGEETTGKTVVVKGALHKDVLVIAVKEFEVKAAAAGGLDEWDELGVKTLSQQPVI